MNESFAGIPIASIILYSVFRSSSKFPIIDRSVRNPPLYSQSFSCTLHCSLSFFVDRGPDCKRCFWLINKSYWDIINTRGFIVFPTFDGWFSIFQCWGIKVHIVLQKVFLLRGVELCCSVLSRCCLWADSRCFPVSESFILPGMLCTLLRVPHQAIARSVKGPGFMLKLLE